MKVILRSDLEGYGFMGDVIEVKDGFANNYLIPRGLALPATEGNVKHIRDILAQKRRKLEREKESAQKIAKKLEGTIVEVKRKVGEGGKLFGSVTVSDILQALKEKGFELDRKNILMKSGIREIGIHTISVRLHREVSVDIKVDVKPEEEE